MPINVLAVTHHACTIQGSSFFMCDCFLPISTGGKPAKDAGKHTVLARSSPSQENKIWRLNMKMSPAYINFVQVGAMILLEWMSQICNKKNQTSRHIVGWLATLR
jgi:hypothetical protein